MAQANTKNSKKSKSETIKIDTAQFQYRLQEVGMLLSFALATYLFVSMFSYDFNDPAWSHSGTNQGIENFGGLAGAWLADLIFYLFGVLGFMLPIMVFYNGLILVKTHKVKSEYRRQLLILRWIGFFLIMFSGCALASLHFNVVDQILPLDAGGILGQVTGFGFSNKLGFLGATVFHLAIFLGGITLFTGMSWLKFVDYIGLKTLQFIALIVERYDLYKDRRAGRVLMQQREMDFIEKKKVIEGKKPVRIEPVVQQVEQSDRVEKEKQISLFESDPVANEGMPPLNLLDEPSNNVEGYSHAALEAMSRQLELKLQDFGIEVEVQSVLPGPVITRFEILPAAGVKVSQIANLAKDLARSLSVMAVRVVEVIPGKPVMGIEIPNEQREMVFLSEIIKSQNFDNSSSPLTLALGKDISGNPSVVDLAKMPHLLVAGTTGSGKSVGINSMLLSLLYKATPDQVRMLLIDPKMLELNVYEGIPHLIAPVVTDMKEAANGLRWCVAEMERRYKLMAALGVRNITGYNKKVKEGDANGQPYRDPFFNAEQEFAKTEGDPLEHMPYIVIVVDEFADMMMVVGKKVEELIARLAQKARAAGLHLILATQRPSVDVITGLIKSNIPTRIAFQVSSKIDSRTILDQMGAEQLLGHGDMLYLPPGTSIPDRIHGAFVDDHEVHKVVADIKNRGKPNYIQDVLAEQTETLLPGENGKDSSGGDADPLYDEAVAIVTETRKASISYIQRRLKIGYNRAARIVEEMEATGVVTPVQNGGAREVLAPPAPLIDN